MTNAFRGFAESLKSNRDKRGRKVNLIYSTQLIEEFAFRYGSFNLNSTRNEERTENEHIGKSPSSGDQRFPRRSYPFIQNFTRSWFVKTQKSCTYHFACSFLFPICSLTSILSTKGLSSKFHIYRSEGPGRRNKNYSSFFFISNQG